MTAGNKIALGVLLFVTINSQLTGADTIAEADQPKAKVVVVKAKKKPKPKRSCLDRVPQPYRAEICRVAPKYGADPYLVASILFYENRSYPRTDKFVCSHAAACGVMQFIPSTFRAYGVDGDGDGKAKRESWKDSVASGSNYIGSMKKDLRNTAITYNAGPAYHGSPDSGLPAETRDYVYGVWRAYRYLKG